MPLPVDPCCWQHLDDQGDLMPWYTKPFLDQLRNWDLLDKDVLEFGGGYSTLWWAKSARSVYTIEDNRDWAQTIEKNLTSRGHKNALIVHEEDAQSYLNRAGSQELYDIVIIDGSHRTDCASVALQVVKPNGRIILDNSEWWWNKADRPIHDLLRYNEHHSYPQPRHPDWRTDYWVIRTKERWDHLGYEEAAHAEEERRRGSRHSDR